MILAIDTGNTHIVLGCIDQRGKISNILRLETNVHKTEYEYAAQIKQILDLEGVDINGFEGAIISSSVPPIIEILRRAVRIITGLNAMVVGVGVAMEIWWKRTRPRTAIRSPVSSLTWGLRQQ